MKLRERLDELGTQLALLTAVMLETRTPQNKFALPYELRLKVDEVRVNLQGLGYEIHKPKQLRLSGLIKQHAKASAKANALTVQGIRDMTLDAIPKHEPAWAQVKAATGASGILESTVFDFVEAETRAYLHGPELENIES